MTTITIPRQFTKGEELIVMPRKEYERLLRFPQKEIAFDRELQEALEDIKAKKVVGPFDNAGDLISSLKKSK